MSHYSGKFNPVSLWFSPLLAKDRQCKISIVERGSNPTLGASLLFPNLTDIKWAELLFTELVEGPD